MNLDLPKTKKVKMETDDCILDDMEMDKDLYIIEPENNFKNNIKLAESKNSLASNMYKEKNYALSKKLYTEAINLNPNCSIYYANRAASSIGLYQFDCVLQDLNKSISLDPTYIKAYTRKFNFFIMTGELEKAEETIEVIEKIDQSLVDSLKNTIKNLKSNLNYYFKAVSNNNPREAIFYIDKVLTHCLNSNNFKLKKAEALALLARQNEVLDIVDPILRKDSNNSDALYIRGLCFFYRDEFDKAIAHFQKALRSEPEHKKAQACYKKVRNLKNLKEEAKIFLEKNIYDKAIECYERALEIEPENKFCNAKLYFNMSIVCGKQKKTKEAVDFCTKAIDLDQNYKKAYMKRASLYDELEMYEECVRDYEYLNKTSKTREINDLLERSKMLLAKSKRKNYYKILGVSETADKIEITKAYRKRAKDHHPDRHANSSEEEKLIQEKKFKDLSEAYTVLTDPVKRNQYDKGYDLSDNSCFNPRFNPNQYKMFCNQRLFEDIFYKNF